MPSDILERVVADGHLEDADLLRHLDAEPALPQVVDAAAHLRGCGTCVARAEVLRRRRLALARLLADSDAEAAPLSVPKAILSRARARERARWYASPTLRAAAVLLVAGTLAAQPAVRRWAGAQWERATTLARPARRAPVSVAPLAPAPASAIGAVLSFEPASGPFIIRFDEPPAAGSLTIASDTGALATVERLGGDNPELLVTAHGLHVRNTAGDTLRYRVRLPRAMARVYVRSGDAPVASDRVVDLSEREQRIDFGPPPKANSALRTIP